MEYLTLAFVFGLTAGFAPGPLLNLVLSESLRHGAAAGVRVSLAPLISDTPIVIGSLWLVNRVAQVEAALGWLTLLGAVYVFYLGVSGLRQSVTLDTGTSANNKGLQQAVIANLLNPHPYLFWTMVGAPTVIRAWNASPWLALGFGVIFYVLLVGSKMMLAFVTGYSRQWLHGRWYHGLLFGLNLLLCIFALLLAYEGFDLIRR